MKRKSLVVVIIAACALSSIASVFAYNLIKKDDSGNSSLEKNDKAEERNNTNSSSSGVDFTYAAEVATPAVVHIKSSQAARGKGRPENPYEELLREFYGDNYQSPQQEFPPQQSFGSGVILTRDGYIVTNNHVIQGADEIEVVLNDKRSYQASVIGADPSTDLALIKIKEVDLPYIKFGKSDELKIGNWVVAVGNPFNLNSTVTAGIVSAKGRSINIIREENNMGIESFIQTDAVVNPGNSGGALVNINGELIGINTAIASPTGAFAGYAFAVPETIVKKIVDDLSKYGEVQRALLGVIIQDINAAIAKEKGIGNINGVYINSVANGSAAQKAGLQAGDVIIEINGLKTNSASRLQELIATQSPGDKIQVTYLRKDVRKAAEVILQNKSGGTTLTLKSKDKESLIE